MKTEDFERLKAVCEKEGFTIESYSGGKTAIIGVKDIWDGVEFASVNNERSPIYKIVSQSKKTIKFYSRGLVDKKTEGEIKEASKTSFKPSTEQAYVYQLKKEAFDRFGDIKEGDRFEVRWLEDNIRTIPEFRSENHEFVYLKDIDNLTFRGIQIYRNGVWATKVKERVKVSSHVIECLRQYLNTELSYNQIEHLKGNGTRAKAEFLAQQLEKYLNQEL